MVADEFEIVSVEEAGIDIEIPAVPDEGDTYEEAIEEHSEEKPEEARPNRAVIRRARRASRLHGAGWTRKFRKGREEKPWQQS